MRSNEAKVSLRIYALLVRSKLLQLYREHGFSDDVLGVLAALTLGEKSYLSNEVKSSFASSGAMHVLAVSGLHVGIISVLLNNFIGLFGFFRRRRISKGFLIILLLWGYAFLAGLSPSVMRATFMFSVIELGRSLRQNSNFFNTLGFSAFLMMLIKPGYIFDVGFQLSYLAVGGIVYFQPKLMAFIPVKNKIISSIWSMFTVSLAAQIATTPISLYYFHQFPSYFWLSNFIVVPAAAIILYGSVVFFLTSFIPWISWLVVVLLKNFISGMNWCVKTIEAFPGSVTEGLYISILFVFLMYLFLFFLVRFLQKNKITYLYVVMLVLIGMLLVSILRTHEAIVQDRLIVYNTYPNYLISYLKGNKHYYFAHDDLTEAQKKLLKDVSGLYAASKPEPYYLDEKTDSVHKRTFAAIGNLIMVVDKWGKLKLPENINKPIILRSNNHRILLYEVDEGKIPVFPSNNNVIHLKANAEFYDLRRGNAVIIDFR